MDLHELPMIELQRPWLTEPPSTLSPGLGEILQRAAPQAEAVGLRTADGHVPHGPEGDPPGGVRQPGSCL